MDSELLGTLNLINRVSSLLYKLIQKSIPRIKKEIKIKLSKVKEELNKIGEIFPELNDLKLEIVFKLVRNFVYTFDQ